MRMNREDRPGKLAKEGGGPRRGIDDSFDDEQRVWEREVRERNKTLARNCGGRMCDGTPWLFLVWVKGED